MSRSHLVAVPLRPLKQTIGGERCVTVAAETDSHREPTLHVSAPHNTLPHSSSDTDEPSSDSLLTMKGVLGIYCGQSQANHDSHRVCKENKRLVQELKDAQESQQRSDARYSKLVEKHNVLIHDYNSLFSKHERLNTQTKLFKNEYDALREHNCELDHLRHANGVELQETKQRLVQLKQSITSSTRTPEQISDSDIDSQMSGVYYKIQEVIVKFFRRVPFDYEKLSPEAKQWTIIYIPAASRLPKAYWLHILVSLVSKTFHRRFIPEAYFGMPNDSVVGIASQLVQRFKGLAVTGGGAWLEATLKLINQTRPEELQTARQYMINDMVAEFESDVKDAVKVDWNQPHGLRDQLGNLFNTVLDFFNLLHRQNAVFQLFMLAAVCPEGPGLFDSRIMTAVGGGDEDEVAEGRPLAISVFPTLRKCTSVAGDKLQHVISKAKVVHGVLP